MNDVLAAKRKLQFLTLAQWVSGIFAVIAYAISALNYINQQTLTITIPFSIFGVNWLEAKQEKSAYQTLPYDIGRPKGKKRCTRN